MEKPRLLRSGIVALLLWVAPALALQAQIAVYPTQTGFEVLDISQQTSETVRYAGPGPTSPLPSDIDAVFDRRQRKAIYPTQQGFEILTLNTRSSAFVPFAGGFPTAPLPLGNDVILTPTGTIGVYPSPRGFEVLDIAAEQAALVPFAGPGPGPIAPLPLDVDVVITPDSRRAIYPTPSGFEMVDLVARTAQFVPYDLPAVLGFLPIAVDVSVSPDGRFAVYPTTTGFQVMDIGAGVAKRVAYGGNGPMTPLPIDVDVFITFIGEAIYPTPTGFEVLDLNAMQSELVKFAGNGPTLPLPMSVDAPISSNGANAVYPTQSGFEVLNIQARTSAFVAYAQALATAPIPLGVDVEIANNDRQVVYPGTTGFHLLNLSDNSVRFEKYAGPGPTTPLPLGVDAVITGDAIRAVYPTQQGFEVVDLRSFDTTFVPFGNPPTVAPLPTDVDPSFLTDGQNLVYTTNLGYEILDLSGTGTATAVQYGSPIVTVPLPTGVDPIVTPHLRGFSNDDPIDEDFFPFLFGGFPHWEWEDFWYLGVPGKSSFPEDIEAKLSEAAKENGFDRDQLRFIEAPGGTVAMGMESDSLAEAGLELDFETGELSGVGTTTDHYWFLIWVIGPDHSFIAELWIHHWNIPHFEWEHAWAEGQEADIPLPPEQLEAIQLAAINAGSEDPFNLVYEAAPGGTVAMGMAASSFEGSGMKLDPQTGNISGIANVPGNFWFLIWVRDITGKIIAELWIHHYVIEHIEWSHVWLEDQEAITPIPEDIQGKINGLAQSLEISPDALTYIEAPPGTVAMGMESTALADAEFTLDPKTGAIGGVAGKSSHWSFLVHVFGPNGRLVAELWIHHWVIPRIPHFTWEYTWKPGGEAEFPLPPEILTELEPISGNGIRFEAAEPGLIHHDGLVNDGLGGLGLQVDPETGRFFGQPTPGHGRSLIWVMDNSGEIIAELWIHHWVVPHWERFESWEVGHEGSSEVLDLGNIDVFLGLLEVAEEMKIENFDLNKVTVQEAPAGTSAGDGMVSQPVSESGLVFDPETGTIKGAANTPGEYWHLFWVMGPNGEMLAEIWIYHLIVPPIPHFVWDIMTEPGQAIVESIPGSILESLPGLPAPLDSKTFEAGRDGLQLHDGSVVDGFEKSGLVLLDDGTVLGLTEEPGCWQSLIIVRDALGQITAEIWVNIWVVEHLVWEHTWVQGEFAEMPLSEDIQSAVATAAERAGISDLSTIRYEEAPAGTVSLDGIKSQPLAEGFLELNPETGATFGTPFSAGEHAHLIRAVSEEGKPLIEIWILHKILPHFIWEVVGRLGETTNAELPFDILLGVTEAAIGAGLGLEDTRFQASDFGTEQDFLSAPPTSPAAVGLNLDSTTGTLQGPAAQPGNWIIPVEAFGPDGEIIGLVWIYYWVLPPIPHLEWTVSIPANEFVEVQIADSVVNQARSIAAEAGLGEEQVFFGSAPRGASSPDGKEATALIDLGLNAFSFGGPPTLFGLAEQTGEFQSLIWLETEDGGVIAEIWVNITIGDPFVSERPIIEYFIEGGLLFLQWNGPFGLQFTQEIGGAWELIDGATSPFFVDPAHAFGVFRLIASEDKEEPGTVTPDPGGQPVTEVIGVEDVFDAPPIQQSAFSVAANDTVPEGARFELVDVSPEATSAGLGFNSDNGAFVIRPLSFTSLITFTYRIVTAEGASEPIQVTIRVVNDLLVELEEDIFGNVDVPVLIIGEKNYPLFQFLLTNSPFDACGEPHYHADLFFVFPIGDPDAAGEADPNPPGCGFGKEADLGTGSISVLAGTWANFLDKYRAANTP